MDDNRETRATAYASLAGLEVGDGHPVRIMGAINVSPESFYKGSVAPDENALCRRAEEMAAAGADILDIGAMSTAPYLETIVGEEEEIRRLAWAVGVLRKAVALPVSADTTRHRVALAALDAGAAVINDVSGFRHDPAMARAAQSAARGVVLMASEGAPPGGPGSPGRGGSRLALFHKEQRPRRRSNHGWGERSLQALKYERPSSEPWRWSIRCFG